VGAPRFSLNIFWVLKLWRCKNKVLQFIRSNQSCLKCLAEDSHQKDSFEV
jgi:hypothetical protein